MNFALRACLLCAAILLAFAPPAGAQQPLMPVNVTSVADSGRFVVFDHGKPVANETFEYDVTGDSLLVTAMHTRKLRASDGVERLLRKNFGMVVDGFDFGLRSYTSNLDFDGHVNVRGLLPGDTSMTVYYETDGAGDASRIVQPPGRLFVMDPLLFTLFDVIGKNVHGKSFASRPIQLIALGKEAMAVEAQVSRAGSDTVQWGARRVITERFTLTDPGSSFVMWVNDKGQMLRLENRANDLVVLREAPAPVTRAATKRATPKQRPAAR